MEGNGLSGKERERERERGRVHPDSKMLRVSLSKRLDLLVLFYLPEKPVDWRRMCQLQLCYVLQDPSSSSSVSLVSFRYVPPVLLYLLSPVFGSLSFQNSVYDLFVPCTQFLSYDCTASTCGSLALILFVFSLFLVVPFRRHPAGLGEKDQKEKKRGGYPWLTSVTATSLEETLARQKFCSVFLAPLLVLAPVED